RSASAANDDGTPTKWTSMGLFGPVGDFLGSAIENLVEGAADRPGIGGSDDDGGRGPRVRDHRGHRNDHADAEESEFEALLESSPSAIGEADKTLDELRDRLSGSYEFTVFVPGSVNYGLLLTYRQEWSPVRYQVGRLVDT